MQGEDCLGSEGEGPEECCSTGTKDGCSIRKIGAEVRGVRGASVVPGRVVYGGGGVGGGWKERVRDGETRQAACPFWLNSLWVLADGISHGRRVVCLFGVCLWCWNQQRRAWLRVHLPSDKGKAAGSRSRTSNISMLTFRVSLSSLSLSTSTSDRIATIRSDSAVVAPIG